MNNPHRKNKTFWKEIFSRNEILFGATFLIVFLITFILLYAIGLIPKEFLAGTNDKKTIVDTIQDDTFQKIGLNTNTESIPTSTSHIPVEDPIKIEAPSIGLNFKIVNPQSTDYITLDNALVSGVVHYPGSGSAEEGNMFLFGHSTGYKYVNNPAYKVFNNIHNLHTDDQIYIYTANKKYTYKVISVELVDSRQALVDFSNNTHMLTLSTCNSFGQKTDRYVVEASFVSSNNLY